VKRPLWKSALFSFLAGAALAVFGNIPGMGLPGALLMVPATPLILLLYGLSPAQMFPQDSAWPFMILLTLAMGPLVPLCWLATRFWGFSGWRRAAWFAGGFLLAGTGLAVLLYGLVPEPAGSVT
jgi:hypothetical protein